MTHKKLLLATTGLGTVLSTMSFIGALMPKAAAKKPPATNAADNGQPPQDDGATSDPVSTTQESTT